jgi:nicotinamide riboside transporter PnuC
MHRHPHVLNASSNLLGICFVLIGALKLTRSNAGSFADETAWAAAAMFLVSIVASYAAIRNNDTNWWQNLAADVTFFGGVGLLALAMVITAAVL